MTDFTVHLFKSLGVLRSYNLASECAQELLDATKNHPAGLVISSAITGEMDYCDDIYIKANDSGLLAEKLKVIFNTPFIKIRYELVPGHKPRSIDTEPL